MNPSDASPVPAVAYKVKDKAGGWSRVICPDCITDHPEDDYVYAESYDGTPEPLSQADLDGWSEGRGVSCDSCCVELVR